MSLDFISLSPSLSQGFSGFYYTAQFFHFDNIPLNATALAALFDENVTDFCNLNYSKVLHGFNDNQWTPSAAHLIDYTH